MANVSRSLDLFKTMGVVTHIGTGQPSQGYMDASVVQSQTSWLGIQNIRDIPPGSSTQHHADEINQLAAAGIKFDMLTPGSGNVNLSSFISELDQLQQAHPGSIASIEGPNEVDIWPVTYKGSTGYSAAIEFQKDLYAAVHSDPLLKTIPVLDFSLGGILPKDAGIPDLTQWTDIANVHTYIGDGTRPAWVTPYAVQGFASDVVGKPVIITETGYNTLSSVGGGISEPVEAIYGLDILLDNFKNGVQKTYFYELEDEASISSDSDQAHFGLFHSDGTPKMVANSFHNLSSILSDTGTTSNTFTPANLNVHITGLPWTASTLVFEKSSGVYEAVVWDEQALWNAGTHQSIAPTSTPITFDSGLSGAQSINVYDPVTGTSVAYSQGSTINVNLSADPLVFEITTSNTFPAPSSTTHIDLGDKAGHTLSVGSISSGTLSENSLQTGLLQSVQQSVGANGVNTISTPLWGSVNQVGIVDSSGHSWATNAFLEVNATLSGASNGSLLLTNAKRGNIDLDGNYRVTINAHSDGNTETVAGQNNFVITAHTGEHIISLRGDGSLTHGVFTSGSGHDVFMGANGGNQITFGSGRAEVTGGVGSDSYIYHANSGVDIIQNFDSVHDLITIDQSLKNSMKISHGAEGTTLMFGSAQHELVLHAVQNFDSGLIHWN